jgi:hypothetical protein
VQRAGCARLQDTAPDLTRCVPPPLPSSAAQFKADFVGDLVAAMTVTAVAAPEAVSYAAIADLPAEQGLYTGLLAPLAYALTGASPQLIVGPTAIMCILTHNAIPVEWGGAPVSLAVVGATRVQLAAALALAVAALQAVIALLRLGGLINLIRWGERQAGGRAGGVGGRAERTGQRSGRASEAGGRAKRDGPARRAPERASRTDASVSL